VAVIMQYVPGGNLVEGLPLTDLELVRRLAIGFCDEACSCGQMTRVLTWRENTGSGSRHSPLVQMNKIVVLVTHDVGEAGFFGDVVLLLVEGRVVQKGTLDDFIRVPAADFVRRFVNAQRLHTIPETRQ
jgi:hypothetical protein